MLPIHDVVETLAVAYKKFKNSQNIYGDKACEEKAAEWDYKKSKWAETGGQPQALKREKEGEVFGICRKNITAEVAGDRCVTVNKITQVHSM